jgi:hypothetical protein
MTSTDLAHALAIPLDTPGCWGEMCSDCNQDALSQCACKQPDTYDKCLWPLPDSGEPGAELWTYWLLKALHYPSLCHYVAVDLRIEFKVNDRMGAVWCDTPQAALYAAWKEQKK